MGATDGKTYTLGGDHQLTDEQREIIKKHQQQQEEKTQQFAKQQLESGRTRLRATLEQLLKTKIDPEEDRVVVWPDEVETMTEGGLHKPQEAIAKERPCIGTVIAVGPGKTVAEDTTNYLLMLLLQYGSDIPKSDMEKVKEEVKNAYAIKLAPGTRILYGRLAGTPVPDPETKEELLIMRPSDIFAKFKD